MAQLAGRAGNYIKLLKEKPLEGGLEFASPGIGLNAGDARHGVVRFCQGTNVLFATVAKATVEVLSFGERPFRHGLILRACVVVTGDDVAIAVVSGPAICDHGLHGSRSVGITPDPPGVG